VLQRKRYLHGKSDEKGPKRELFILTSRIREEVYHDLEVL
jgi:hypothetical protein